MRRTKTPLMCSLVVTTAILLVSIPIFAQTVPMKALPPGTGLSVDRLDYDQATRTVTVTFRNSGKLEITAFGWSLNLRRPSSSALMHYETVDLLPLLALRGINGLT